MPNYVSGIGSLTPDLLICGESPGKYEDEQGIPFVGPTGQILNDILFKNGIRRSDCYLTNVVKFRPPLNDFNKLHLIDVNLEDSVRELWNNEINQLKPKVILAVGDVALEAATGLSGILNYRGSILLARDGVTKVVPTIHPAALFSHEGGKGGLSYTYLKLIESDIARAIEESKTKELILPQRELTIAHNSLDLFRFFRQYDGLEKAVVDIESINCVPVCVGFAFNRYHAISVPLLSQIGKHKLTDMGDSELDECWRMIYDKLQVLKLIGHNLMYDEFKMSLIGFEMPNVYSDTLIKARVIFPELPDKRLCSLSSLWTREPYYKDDGKEFRLGKDRIDNLLHYNGRDCAVNFEVDEETDKDLIEMAERFKVPLVEYYRTQMRKHKLYLKFQNNGFAVDLDRQRELKKIYTGLQDVAHTKLTGLIGHEVNVKSYPQMFQLLYREMKYKIRKKDPTSEDSIVALLSQSKKKEYIEILEVVLEERRIRDQRSRAINFSPDYDGRCKSSYNIISTETCRSSTGILKKPLRPRKIGLAFHTIPAHGRLGKDIKSMLVPDKGKVIIKADSSQAEARIVAVLAKDWELLEAFDKVDIHRRTAGLIFGYTTKLELSVDFKHPIVDNLPKDGPERFTGKTTRHAGNYLMGKHTHMVSFNTACQKAGIKMNISEWKANKDLEVFHAASPKIKEVFHADIRNCIGSTRVLIDPFGGVRVFNGRMDEEIYKEGFANIPQRTVAHLVQNAALSIDDELNGDTEVMMLGEKHDELVLQVPENNYEVYGRMMRKHMMAPIDFSIYCSLKRDYVLVIPCDVSISKIHYGESESIKF